MLNDILKIPHNEIQDYKIRFMVSNGYDEPLVTMSRNFKL